MKRAEQTRTNDSAGFSLDTTLTERSLGFTGSVGFVPNEAGVASAHENICEVLRQSVPNVQTPQLDTKAETEECGRG